jgi:UDP-N-acetylmuramate--alanine ligase
MRRFEIKGESNGVLVVDDYAHHPSEIKATLEAARKGWDRRIVAVFQPHTFTRTQTFYKDFARSFDDADVVVITDVYPAREEPIEGVTGDLIANQAKSYGLKNIHYVPDFNDICTKLLEIVKENDIVITIGAGSIYKISDQLLEQLSNKH